MACQYVGNMKVYTGREKIFSKFEEIHAGNVVEALSAAMGVHNNNRNDIDYLYSYYKGRQPILYRTKEIRPELTNRIVVNRANEIVTFKTGYLLGQAIQYIRKDGTDDLVEDVKRLNSYMMTESKDTKDISLATWMYICGTGYRIVLPKPGFRFEEDEAPFDFFTLDPRNTFVAYSSEVGNAPLWACNYINRPEDNKAVYTVYTRDKAYMVVDDSVEETPNLLGGIPIIEYPENDARLGSFEIVLGILDAINTTESNRLDGVEQFVQALLVLKGVDLPEGNSISDIVDSGGILLPIDGDAKYLVQELNQGQVQTLVNDMEDTMLTICGMPNRNGGSSTSDTGSAVLYRDGWSDAETRAMNTQRMWTEPETRFIRMAINIVNLAAGKGANGVESMKLRAHDIIPHFNRQNSTNLQSKTQSLCELLANEKVHPKWAWTISGAAHDIETAYADGMAWYEEQEQKRVNELMQTVQDEPEENTGNEQDENAE